MLVGAKHTDVQHMMTVVLMIPSNTYSAVIPQRGGKFGGSIILHGLHAMNGR